MTITLLIENGDFVLNDSVGRFKTASETTKARQTLREMLAIETQPNGFGASLDTFVGTVPEDEFTFSAQVQRAIRQSFAALLELQARYQAVDRTDEEQLARIRKMFVTPVKLGDGTTSKTAYALSVDTLTLSGLTVQGGGILVGSQGG
jgi:hypothetical protein